MEYETDEEVLHYDEASNSGSSDGVISESDNEISFDEPEPITPPSPPNRAFPLSLLFLLILLPHLPRWNLRTFLSYP